GVGGRGEVWCGGCRSATATVTGEASSTPPASTEPPTPSVSASARQGVPSPTASSRGVVRSVPSDVLPGTYGFVNDGNVWLMSASGNTMHARSVTKDGSITWIDGRFPDGSLLVERINGNAHDLVRVETSSYREPIAVRRA